MCPKLLKCFSFKKIGGEFYEKDIWSFYHNLGCSIFWYKRLCPDDCKPVRIGIGGEEFDVQDGDVVFIPEGVPHWYQNVGEEDFEFLCMIPNKPDEIRIVDEKGC